MTNKLDIEIRDGLMYARVPFWSIAEEKYLKAFVLIDTGACVNSFGESALKRLGCLFDGRKHSVNTANGFVDVQKTVVPKSISRLLWKSGMYKSYSQSNRLSPNPLSPYNPAPHTDYARERNRKCNSTRALTQSRVRHGGDIARHNSENKSRDY